MGVEYQAFAYDEPTSFPGQAKDIAAPPTVVLPEVPHSILQRVLCHMTPVERAYALQNRLVPIAWLPHMTLYADAAPSPEWRAKGTSPLAEQIVARIEPKLFHSEVQRFLRSKLTDEATDNLRQHAPAFSAHARLSQRQMFVALLFLLVFAAAAWLLPINALTIALGFGFLFLFWPMIGLRVLALGEASVVPRDHVEMDDSKLPVYSVLVPAFRETRVLPQLIDALCNLNYLRDKLDIKLVLEETDTAMQRAVAALELPSFIEVLIVPAGKPQTKPRALNYALQFARGSLLTIYDAEDIPEPMQLRAAAKAFAVAPDTLACLQAELAFYNPNENWLTRQFAVEYAVLFKLLLPSLAKYRLPLPLGGTSNHFRAGALRMVGGWDPYNVTEDADLGFRLARYGFDSGSLASTTYEEANTELRNWLHQRSRWLKGFLQTWLVHMRNPVALIDEVGFSGFVVLQATVLGILVSATLQPVFLTFVAVTLCHDLITAETPGLPPLMLNSFFIGNMLTGGTISLLCGFIAAKRAGLRGFGLTLVTMPLYWLLATIAGWMAVWQFIVRPFHWNKTRHGLSRFMAQER